MTCKVEANQLSVFYAQPRYKQKGKLSSFYVNDLVPELVLYVPEAQLPQTRSRVAVHVNV